MKVLLSITSIIFFMLLFTYCIEPLNLKLKEEDAKLVVYGLINNQDDSCVVKLSYTSSYLPDNQTNKNPIKPAIASKVLIKDNENNEFELKAIREGVYVHKTLKGKVGNSYTLHIELPNGKKYQSNPEILSEVPSIDSISNLIIEEPRFINNALFKDIALQVNVHFRDTDSEENFYKWKWVGEATFRINTEVLPPIGSNIPVSCYYKMNPYPLDPYEDEINVLSDKNINGQKYQHSAVKFSSNVIDYRFHSGANILIGQYSLTKSAYQYWEKLARLINSQGSIFDPAPFQVIGNIYNVNNEKEVVLGYFGASGVKYMRYQFHVSGIKTAPCLFGNFFAFCPDCRKFSNDYSLNPPVYWLN